MVYSSEAFSYRNQLLTMTQQWRNDATLTQGFFSHFASLFHKGLGCRRSLKCSLGFAAISTWKVKLHIWLFELFDFSNYLTFQIIWLFKLFDFSNYLTFQVIWLFKLYDFSNYLNFQIIWLFKLFEFSNYLTFQIIWLFK
jgi:hypothetical protein